jgi:hypothetical protein
MTERLSHELPSLLAEDEGCLDQVEARGLLRARLVRDMSEGLAQSPRAASGDEAGMLDHARIAAYLDGSLSRDERDAVAAKLADDPVLRSEVASALLLLDRLEAHAKTAPAALVARAVGILAAAQPIGPRAVAVRHAPVAIWWRRPAALSGLAAVLLAALTPGVVSMVRDRNEAAGVRDVKGGSPDRGVVPLPAGKGGEPDTRSCERPVARGAKAPDRPDEPSSAAPDDDPCRPKPLVDDDLKPKRP